MLPNVEELTRIIAEVLLKSGIAVGELTRANPIAVDKAASFVIGKVPALRFVPGGRERIRGLVLLAIDRLPKHPDDQSSLASDADLTAYIVQLAARVRERFGDTVATGRNHFGYRAENDVECSRLMRDLETADSCSFASAQQHVEISLLKARVLGSWQKAQGTKSNHQHAVECYEDALRMARALPETEAEVRFRYAMFSLEAPKEIGGGEDKAIGNLNRAVEVAPAGSELQRRCSEELARHTKKRFAFF